MASPPRFPVTSGGKEYIAKIADVLTLAFRDDPVFAWLIHQFPVSEHQTVLSNLLRAFFSQSSLNKGIFVEIDNFGCCGVLMPPGTSIENPWTLLQAGLLPALFTIGPGTFKRAIIEYGSNVEPMLHKIFTKEELKNHWYVFIMGTEVSKRHQGLASALIQNVMERARNDKRPVWLEATTRNSHGLYTRQGFQTVGEVVLGKCQVDSNGLSSKGGPGVTIWAMYWRP